MKNRIKAKAVTQLSRQFSGLKVATENKTIKGRRQRREREREKWREGGRKRRDCDETERQESGGQRGMQFASRRSFCRRVTFHGFREDDSTTASMVSLLRISVNSDSSGNNFNRKPGWDCQTSGIGRSTTLASPMTREKQPRRCINFRRSF